MAQVPALGASQLPPPPCAVGLVPHEGIHEDHSALFVSCLLLLDILSVYPRSTRSKTPTYPWTLPPQIPSKTTATTDQGDRMCGVPRASSVNKIPSQHLASLHSLSEYAEFSGVGEVKTLLTQRSLQGVYGVSPTRNFACLVYFRLLPIWYAELSEISPS